MILHFTQYCTAVRKLHLLITNKFQHYNSTIKYSQKLWLQIPELSIDSKMAFKMYNVFYSTT